MLDVVIHQNWTFLLGCLANQLLLSLPHVLILLVSVDMPCLFCCLYLLLMVHARQHSVAPDCRVEGVFGGTCLVELLHEVSRLCLPVVDLGSVGLHLSHQLGPELSRTHKIEALVVLARHCRQLIRLILVPEHVLSDGRLGAPIGGFDERCCAFHLNFIDYASIFSANYKISTLEMDIRRNQPMQPSKPTSLMQPLLTISKASTPVRTRIVGQHGPLNSTPIMTNKIKPTLSRSPLNKENIHNNQLRPSGGSKNYTLPAENEHRINLSPVLALNRKLNQGPQAGQKKSLTPQNVKIDDYQESAYTTGSLQQRYQTLQGSKGNGSFNHTTNLSGIRNSSSFKDLISVRANTPNRFSSGSSPLKKRESGPMLKQSESTKQIFGAFGRESNFKLGESRSESRFKSQGMFGSQDSQLKCMNNDRKRAKYKVVHEEPDGQTELYYCSKCTIPLVKQGFKVEEISKEYEMHESEDKHGRNREYYSALENKRKACEFILKDIDGKEEDELSQFDHYCNEVMVMLQQQRAEMVGDYAKKKEPLRRLVSHIDSALDCMNDSRRHSDVNYDQILSEKQESYAIDHLYNFKADNHIKRFRNFMTQEHEESSDSNIVQSARNDSIHSRNHAMRFSFEKLLTSKGHKSKPSMMPVMKPLQELEEEQEDEQLLENHTAFRDLFPEGASEEMSKDIYSPTFKNI